MTKHNVKPRSFPQELLSAARKEAADVMMDFSNRGGLEKRIYESYETARKRAVMWAGVSATPFMQARIG